MELLNATGMQAGYTLGLDPDGREHVVVVVKGTFAFPENGGVPELAEEQVPLVMADVFTGQPGHSATLYESEYSAYKPRCDVLLNGSAYAPGGHPVERVSVAVGVGSLRKSFAVVGDRVWENGGFGVRPSAPRPFERLPITYDRAFGGTDVAEDDPETTAAFMDNPAGVGYYPLSKGKALVGKPLPNTEESDKPVTSTSDDYRPMSFGALGRNTQSRIMHAGTYDQDWIDNVFPFLPRDFDPRYYQCAPPDQQIEYPKGGEEVELLNLSPQGRTRFRLPTIPVPVEFTNADYDRTETGALLDTVIIEPDASRLMLVWRTSMPLKRNILEAKQAVVGRMPRGWYRARTLGKTYYPSLDTLVRARSAEGG